MSAPSAEAKKRRNTLVRLGSNLTVRPCAEVFGEIVYTASSAGSDETRRVRSEGLSRLVTEELCVRSERWTVLPLPVAVANLQEALHSIDQASIDHIDRGALRMERNGA